MSVIFRHEGSVRTLTILRSDVGVIIEDRYLINPAGVQRVIDLLCAWERTDPTAPTETIMDSVRALLDELEEER
jgi:hypothetical protein